MKIFLLFLWTLLIPLFIVAQKTTISGTVSGAEGQMIRLITYDDFISKKIITLDKSEIDQNGRFELTVDITETILAFLDINYQRAEIFLEPEKKYSLEVVSDQNNQLQSYFDRQGLQYDFKDPDPDNLNLTIWRFNTMYNKFVMENFDQIYKLHDKSKVTVFNNEVAEEFQSEENEYFQNYVTYKLADVEQYARLKGKKQLANDYFTNKPVLYNNVEYTFFFNEFFAKFLITSPDVITISEMIVAVNEVSDNSLIMDAMAKVPYLEDANFRELVLLHGLKGLYHNGTYKKPQVLMMILDISQNTEDSMHRKIADNLLKTLTRLMPGSLAPDIRLTKADGSEFNLREIKGKPILLNFFRSGQTGTEDAFDALFKLYYVYKSGLEIISVSMDPDPSGLAAYVNSGKYNWTFAHYGNDPLVYDLYNIKDLPLYVLIDIEGNIAAYPAPSPGEELEKAVLKIIH